MTRNRQDGTAVPNGHNRAMPERSDVIFDSGLDAFGAVVERIDASDWDRPSPCGGWTARDVLGHLGMSVNMGISMLQGEQPSRPEVDRPAAVVGEDPAAYWRTTAARARAALKGADLDVETDTPMGKRTVADRLAFPAVDLFVHAWDVGRAAGIDVEVPAEVIEFTHGHIDPIPVEMVRGANGAFGPEVEVPEDASPTEAFIAWTGRDPRWRA